MAQGNLKRGRKAPAWTTNSPVPNPIEHPLKVHGSPTLQPTGVIRSTTDELVPDSTGHPSPSVHASTSQSQVLSTVGPRWTGLVPARHTVA